MTVLIIAGIEYRRLITKKLGKENFDKRKAAKGCCESLRHRTSLTSPRDPNPANPSKMPKDQLARVYSLSFSRSLLKI